MRRGVVNQNDRSKNAEREYKYNDSARHQARTPAPSYDKNTIANTTPTSPAPSDTPMVAAPPVLAGDAPELVLLDVDFAPLAPELAVAPDGVG
jgi:hypothetical protein